MASPVIIPLQGSSVDIVKRCETALSDIVQSKFSCSANVEGMDMEMSLNSAHQKGPNMDPQKGFSGELPSGVLVSVWKNDLTNAKVEAVVNAANERLQHYGGLALALCRVGGPTIQMESDDYIRKYGTLKTGEAVIGCSGKLPCQNIIHAVGPCLPFRPNPHQVTQAKAQLQKTIRSILTIVKVNKVKTVAIPAISSGIFNFPLPTCADTIVSTVKEFYEKSPKGPFPDEILLMNNDDPSVKEMERACNAQLMPTASNMNSSKASASAAVKYRHPDSLTVYLNAVHLKLKLGRIEEEKVDVIVNTVGPDRDLNLGAISRTLLMKAGPRMQQDVRSAIAKGNVRITKGYALPCKDVFHTSCNQGREILYQSVQQCLYLAVANNHRTISFPAIGTGKLGFSKEMVARTMSDALENFAMKNVKPLEVHFVIFPSDIDTFKAFEDAIRSLQQKVSPSNLTPAAERSRATFPHISLHGPKELMEEAERWLTGLLGSSNTVIIYNNFIQHFGMEEHEQLVKLSSQRSVHIEECFNKGHAFLKISGDSQSDVIMAVVHVEAMLCNIQRVFIKEEERAMLPFTNKNVTFERTPIHADHKLFTDTSASFKKEGLRVVKMESVDNTSQVNMFDARKKHLQNFQSQKLYQCIPAQFCEMVSHVGFHTEYAPPAEPRFGEGIYFAATVKTAMEVWKEQIDKYLYFVEAEVLIGKSIPGEPDLILPIMGPDRVLYDSAIGRGVCVIGSGYQALPKYIITCQREGWRG